MLYFVAIFFPFVSFFYIKKPVSGYFAFVFHVLAFLGVSIYPTVYILFIIWFLLIMWAFFEINEFNSQETVLQLVKKLVRQNKLLLKDITQLKKDRHKVIDYDFDYDDIAKSKERQLDKYDNYRPSNSLPVKPLTTNLPPYQGYRTSSKDGVTNWARPRRVIDYAPQIKEDKPNPLYKPPTLPSSYSPRNRSR